MTTRLYYDDAYATEFTARVIERTTHEGRPAVRLDRSYFYPTSGGQPYDTGTIAGVPVLDVAARESDGAVLHVLGGDLSAQAHEVCAVVDWPRRFDHMQHHTGQHILSQAFVQVAGAETVGFHLSPDSVTIDLNRPEIPTPLLDAAEELANRIVTEDRPVRCWFPAADELAALPLRKVPGVEGRLRVVEVQGFDWNACGGTHVRRTGEIGLIKVLRAERRGGTLRVEFRCGGRALHDYRAKHHLLQQLAGELTTGYEDIPAVLGKLRDEHKSLTRDVRALREALLAHEAADLWARGVRHGAATVVAQGFEGRDAGELRQIVQQLIAQPRTVALLGLSGEKAYLIAARSPDVPHDMVGVLRRGLSVWGIERGGGRPDFAQGGGASSTPAEVQAALDAMLSVVTGSEA